MTDVRYLVGHCSATPADMDIGRKEIDLWHRQQGWDCIGYHSVIRRDGTEEFGRPFDRPGAHVVGYNSQSLGVCLVGGVKRAGKELVTEFNFEPAQLARMVERFRAWRELWPLAIIVGHRDLAVDPKTHRRLKDCPSFDLRAWLKANTDIDPL